MAILRLTLLTAAVALASASLDSMLADSLDQCIGSEGGTEACLRGRVLDYLGAPRSGGGGALAGRVLQILKSHDVKVQLPEALQGATLVFKPGRGLDFDIEFPHENDVTPRAGKSILLFLSKCSPSNNLKITLKNTSRLITQVEISRPGSKIYSRSGQA